MDDSSPTTLDTPASSSTLLSFPRPQLARRRLPPQRLRCLDRVDLLLSLLPTLLQQAASARQQARRHLLAPQLQLQTQAKWPVILLHCLYPHLLSRQTNPLQQALASLSAP